MDDKKTHCILKTTDPVRNTRRCVKSAYRDETSDQCAYNRSTRSCSIPKSTAFVTFLGFRIQKSLENFLKKKIMNQSANHLRRHAHPSFPLHDIPEDRRMKEYVARELLTLAKQESNTPVIPLKKVKELIQIRDDLNWIMD